MFICGHRVQSKMSDPQPSAYVSHFNHKGM